MTDLRKAAGMALVALNSFDPHDDELWYSEKSADEIDSAITALRQALAQPEQRGHCTCGDPEALGVVHFRTRPCFHYTEPLAQPEQEPVAWMNNDYEVFFDAGKAACYSMGWIKPLYTAPPKREWVGLTMQEYVEIENNVAAHYAPNNVPRSVRVFAQVLWETIEAKLKKKNT